MADFVFVFHLGDRVKPAQRGRRQVGRSKGLLRDLGACANVTHVSVEAEKILLAGAEVGLEDVSLDAG